jgi:hypothetical protein
LESDIFQLQATNHFYPNNVDVFCHYEVSNKLVALIYFGFTGAFRTSVAVNNLKGFSSWDMLTSPGPEAFKIS